MPSGRRLRTTARTALLAMASTMWLASCSSRHEEQASAAQPPAGSAAAPRADHRNAEYSIGGRSVRLIDGWAEEPAAPGSAAKIVTRYFDYEARGDVNGDGREDVVFLLTQQPGGSGTFFYAVVALDSEHGVVGSQAVLLGDRIAPQATEVQPGGVIAVAYKDRAPGESFSTPPSIAKSIRLELDPATLQLAQLLELRSNGAP